MTQQINTLVDRVVSPTPKWFKKLRNIGITVSAVGAVIISAPLSLPTTLVTIAGYMILAGGVMGAVSQTAKK